MHDALALLPVARPELVPPGSVRHEPATLEVVCDHGPARGMTIVDRRGIRAPEELPPDRRPARPNVAWAVEVDCAAVVEAVVEALLAYP